jgi:hypothetical protein
MTLPYSNPVAAVVSVAYSTVEFYFPCDWTTALSVLRSEVGDFRF